MNIQAHQTKVPVGWSLQTRDTTLPGNDERPLLRDTTGRVLAAVEVWVPEASTTTGRRAS
jgi:hypothetical protein